MPDNGLIALANAIFGTTSGTDEGILYNAAMIRLAAAITSISSGGTVLWVTGSGQGVEAPAVGATLTGSGNSTIVCSTSPNTNAYTVPQPASVGLGKTIACITGTTSGTATVTCATGTKFVGTGAGTIATFSSQGALVLMSTTTSQWCITTMSTLCVIT